MTMDSTEAKIGRSMKKCENIMFAVCGHRRHHAPRDATLTRSVRSTINTASGEACGSTSNTLQLHDRLVPLLGEFLTYEAVILVEPQIDGPRRRGDEEAIAVLPILADRDLLHADVLQVADVLLAGIDFEDGHLLVVESRVGEAPVRVRPGIGSEGRILAVDAHAELLVVSHADGHFGFLAVVGPLGFHADEPAVLPPFLGLEFERVVHDDEVAELD